MSKLYKYLFNLFKEPLYLLFVLVAVFVWYLNRLNTTFQRDVMLPVYIEGVENPKQNRNHSYFEVFCRVEAKGYSFLRLQLFPLYQMASLSLSELGDIPITNNKEIKVNTSLLEGKVAGRVKGLDIIRIFDDYIEIPLIVNGQKRVKVSADIHLKTQGGYMQLGDVDVEPDSITISGRLQTLNTIDSVFTEIKMLSSTKSRISGEVKLIEIPGITYSIREVEYNIVTDRFAESKSIVAYDIETTDTTIVSDHLFRSPAIVEVAFNVVQKLVDDFSPDDLTIYATYADSLKIGDNLYELFVKDLPVGVTLQYIEPRYVTILRKSNTQNTLSD
ncbi:MAG: hypothetical protein R3Y04_02870 [Rikenellaceae bacterium]